jgi:xylulokinase
MNTLGGQTYVLGIDLGSHGPKVGIVSEQGEIVGWEFEPALYHLTPNGGAEQDPNEWWEAIVKATRRLVDRELVPAEKIVAIGPSAQWAGTVAVDSGGQPLMNAITWMDSRGASYNRKVYGGPPYFAGYGLVNLLQFVYYNGGGPSLSGKDAIGHALYIKHEHPEIYRDTAKFLEVKDYINLRLTGRTASSVETMMTFFVMDIRDPNRIQYAPRLLKLAGLPREKLPDLKRSTDVLGTLSQGAARQLGLLESTQVVLGAPDMHATAIGAGSVRDFNLSLYLGSSSFLTTHVPFRKVDQANYLSSWPSAIPGRYMILGTQDWAAGSLDYFLEKLVYPSDDFRDGPVSKNGFLPEDAFIRLNRAVENLPPGSQKVIFMPWLYGEHCPIDDAAVRGSFSNVSPTTSRELLARAIMEGVAFNGKWMLQACEGFCRRRLGPINAVGGGAISDVWLQIHADVFDRPVRQVVEPRLAPLRGAAFIALAGLGALTFDEIPGLIRFQKTCQPNSQNRRLYDELFAEFTGFYKRNKAAFARLNRVQG